nr:hypothetical protein [Clostridia bacterium]
MTRYRPEDGRIVGENLDEPYYSNRLIYCGNTSAYIMAGDRPHVRFCRHRKIFGTMRLFLDGRPLDKLPSVRMEYRPNVVRWDITDGEKSFSLSVTTPGEELGFVLHAEPATELSFVFRGIADKRPDDRDDVGDDWNLCIFSYDESLLKTEFDPAWLEGNVSGTVNGICYIENPEVGAKYGRYGRVYVVSDGTKTEKDGVISGTFTRYAAAVSPTKKSGYGLHSAEDYFVSGIKRSKRISSTLETYTPDEYIDAAAQAAAAEMDGAWHPPKMMHGNMTWNTPLVGWMIHGQHLLGLHDRALATLKAYAAAQVKDDVKKGYGRNASGTLPDGDSRFYGQGYIDADQGFYNMQTQFFHQMISAWRYSGGEEIRTILRDALRLHLKREDECFDPDGTGLYESVVNTWPTDSVYTPGGAVEETCYVYYAYKALAELTEGAESEVCSVKAEKIKKAFFDKLWIKERGYPGAFREYGGGHRLHPDAWMYSAFLPVECGLTDMFEAAQCTDYPRRALKREKNGLYWISNWTPGIWSVRECSSGENMQLAIARFRAGDPDGGAEILSDMCRSALDKAMPGELTYPVIESAVQTARAIVEGLVGYRPDYPNGRVVFEPSIPASWNHATVRTLDFELQYYRDGIFVKLKKPARITIRVRVYARSLGCVEGAQSVRLIPGIGGMILEADMGYCSNAELRFATERFCDFDKPEYSNVLPQDMSDIFDPQNSAASPWGHHTMFRKTPEGSFRELRFDLGEDPVRSELIRSQREPVPDDAVFETVDISRS